LTKGKERERQNDRKSGQRDREEKKKEGKKGILLVKLTIRKGEKKNFSFSYSIQHKPKLRMIKYIYTVGREKGRYRARGSCSYVFVVEKE